MRKTGAVIVAAGLSSRMGEFKPMLKLGPRSIIQWIVDTFRQAGVFPIVVVTGFRAEDLEKHLGGQEITFLRNEEYRTTQMFDSSQIGLSYIVDKCDQVFFTPVDVPLFTVDTVQSLMGSDFKIAKPVFGGKTGHPVLLDCTLLPDILAAGAKQGMKTALEAFQEQTAYVEVTDEGILYDADTPQEYKKLLEYYNFDDKIGIDGGNG